MIATNPKVCKYIDMLLQHSEDNILKRMRRSGRQRDRCKLIGNTLDVLIGRYAHKNDNYIGRTQYDAAEVDCEVFVTGYKGEMVNVVKVSITHAYDYDLSGEVFA